jgi:acetylglutamate kinase
VLKLGGELIEGEHRLRAAAASIAALATGVPLVVVHGGGREIDTELARRGITKQAIDGVRVTNAETLDVVVAVLAGTLNTRLVASLVARGLAAVGLTGADAGIGLCAPAPPHRAQSGQVVELGLVGRPLPSAPVRLLTDLCAGGYVPVVASIGVSEDGHLFNVNADTLAAHLAGAAGAARLLLAGATPGVLDGQGRTLPRLDLDEVAAVIADGSASAGMVAKLSACRDALQAGVPEVVIFDGRESLDPVEGNLTRIERPGARVPAQSGEGRG